MRWQEKAIRFVSLAIFTLFWTLLTSSCADTPAGPEVPGIGDGTPPPAAGDTPGDGGADTGGGGTGSDTGGGGTGGDTGGGGGAGTVEPAAMLPSSWTDGGVVLEPGPAGAWDARLSGAISPAAVVKKDGTFLLYYIGADGDRRSDGGPRHRALGVATSSDGLHYAKYAGNPILTYLPHQNEEEGVFSLGATLDHHGRVVIVYSTCEARDAQSTSVSCDARLATSLDGFGFIDRGVVLDHNDRDLWGWGDEIFPVGLFCDGATWYVYYLADGRDVDRHLGIAWGATPGQLTRSRAVLTGGPRIWAGCDPIRLGNDTLALFIDRYSGPLEVRLAEVGTPQELGAAVRTIDFGNQEDSTTFYDADSATWFMYSMDRGEERIRVRSAPLP